MHCLLVLQLDGTCLVHADQVHRVVAQRGPDGVVCAGGFDLVGVVPHGGDVDDAGGAVLAELVTRGLHAVPAETGPEQVVGVCCLVEGTTHLVVSCVDEVSSEG